MPLSHRVSHPRRSSHLTLHRGILYFRILVPNHLQSLLGKCEIRRSLNGLDSRTARSKALRLSLVAQHFFALSEDLVAFCEQQIDDLSAKMEDNGYFILPGGSPVSAHLQLARTIMRRAERRLWTLNRKDPVSPEILQFVNRLSDLLFIMARYEMFRQGNAEERWQSFLYKRKK